MSWDWNNVVWIVFALCLVMMPVTSSQHQQIKAKWIEGFKFNCFGEKACIEGFNNGTKMAQLDWNQEAIGHSLNSGDLNCWITYSIAECHGYIHGYIYRWGQLWHQEHSYATSASEKHEEQIKK
jgi:hypothetical protein